jgi:Fe-S cluster biogenesis protein NfuA/nitrite reductase/ring-hydroxylating ferredoxin subunit
MRMSRVQQVGDQIEGLLARLRSAGPSAAGAAEELVRLLVGLYGDGLTRIVAALRDGGEAGDEILAGLVSDPLVESLLLLHGLHPLDVDARIERALERVRPYLGSHAGGVRYLGVADGVARLRLEGSCHGCPSSAATVRLAVEGAVTEAAPEVTEVEVEGMTAPAEPALLQIGPHPAAGMSGRRAEPGDKDGVDAPTRQVHLTGGADAAEQGTWVSLPHLGPPTSRPVTTSVGGIDVAVCAVRGTLYAYRDACAVCGSSLAGSTMDREVLTCACGSRYDICLAGRRVGGPAAHLDPLPLLADSQGVRVAVPAAVRS